jgi:hypothetical protein
MELITILIGCFFFMERFNYTSVDGSNCKVFNKKEKMCSIENDGFFCSILTKERDMISKQMIDALKKWAPHLDQAPFSMHKVEKVCLEAASELGISIKGLIENPRGVRIVSGNGKERIKEPFVDSAGAVCVRMWLEERTSMGRCPLQVDVVLV